MWTRLSALVMLAGALWAQQVVAPTPEQAGPASGADTGDYNVTNSFETGYRFALIDGNLGMYRSQVNYGNGIRLLGSSLSVDSRDGHGRWFDQILLNTQGLGNDPYQSAILRVQKNQLYRYDMTWRLDEYYNPGVAISGGLHLMDTRRRLQDHDLTILPQSRIKFRAGYSRNTQDGPALSSVQEFTALGNAFPLFTDVRRQWNEYRLGADIELAGFKLTVLRRWDYFKDDSPYSAPNSLIPPSLEPGGFINLQSFSRFEPNHGSNPGWMGDLVATHKYWAINARMTYSGGQNDFALDESALGSTLGIAASRQILVSGNAERPETAGDFSISLFPTSLITVVNNTSANNMRTVGDSTYSEFDDLTGQGTNLNFRYLGVRTVSNSTDVNYRVKPWIGFFAGYQFTDRTITTVEGFASPPGPTDNATYKRNNQLQAGSVGVQLRPVKPLTIRLEAEVGRDNLPLTPISDRNYHTLVGRIDYRTRKLRLSASYNQVYNVNGPVTLTEDSSHSRTYAADASWTPSDRFSLDASYTKLHLDTVSALVFFATVNTPQLQQTPAFYLSNIHAGTLTARIGLSKRADLFVGYSITRDVGDGRGSAVQPGISNPVQVLLNGVETFPLTYESPLARLSIRVSSKLRWNAGYQYYGYHEEFGLTPQPQNYHANTGYTSVSWSF